MLVNAAVSALSKRDEEETADTDKVGSFQTASLIEFGFLSAEGQREFSGFTIFLGFSLLQNYLLVSGHDFSRAANAPI